MIAAETRRLCLPEPADGLSVGSRLFVPEVGQILEDRVIGDNERRDRCAGKGSPLAVVTRDVRDPGVSGPFEEHASAEDFRFANHCS